jgi:hypothetical protein
LLLLTLTQCEAGEDLGRGFQMGIELKADGAMVSRVVLEKNASAPIEFVFSVCSVFGWGSTIVFGLERIMSSSASAKASAAAISLSEIDPSKLAYEFAEDLRYDIV